MFKMFRSDPIAKLEKQYARKLEEALNAQRSGKIPLYATLTGEAEEIATQIEELRRQSSGS